MDSSTLNVQVRSLSATFKSNLGVFLGRIQQQASTVTTNSTRDGDIEALLTDFDRIISNQKQLSDLIQRVKLHQKVSRELETVNEGIKTTQSAILAIIQKLQERDLSLARLFGQAEELQDTLQALRPMLADPGATILAALNLAGTTAAPFDWQPGQPLLNHRPPYPTEDLIRRSALYQLMTTGTDIDVPETKSAVSSHGDSSQATPPPEARPSPSVTRNSRRRGQDKSHLLDIDLNPDL